MLPLFEFFGLVLAAFVEHLTFDVAFTGSLKLGVLGVFFGFDFFVHGSSSSSDAARLCFAIS